MYTITDVFAVGGQLATAAGSRYEFRSGQLDMAVAVASTFKDGGRLLVEAPTGTGKSMSYLVPAILEAAPDTKKLRRTIIVTANIALQEQLIAKDLPYLQSALPDAKFTYALAKGMSNYLCLDKWQDAVAESLVTHVGDPGVWDMLTAWVDRTEAGDLSELATELPPKVRLSVTTNSDDCVGKKCKHYAECYAMEARRKIQSANIVVTNYHLFFADLSIKAGGDTDVGVLPGYSLVVLDEGHQAADISRDFFGWRISFGGIRWAIRMLKSKDQEPVLSSAETFFGLIGRGPGSRGERTNLRISKPGEAGSMELADQLMGAASKLLDAAQNELVEDAREKMIKGSDRARTLAGWLTAMNGLDMADMNVYYAEPPASPNGYWSVGMKPLDVSKILAPYLFDKSSIHAIVVTSATLTTGESFDFVTGQLGLYEAEELIVPSPFDHRGAAVMVVPRDLPDPKSSLFAERVSEVVEQTIRLARGRTLALFTSYRVMTAAYDHVRKLRLPYTLLKQGDAPRTKLIGDFRQDTHSVLFGTDSFWEGIDVQGESLSAVVIDRLPFDHPSDPVFAAICEKNPRGWFMQYAVPRSIIAFRQGFGRLIRSRTDRGVIVVCDTRIVDKPYGRKYLKSLPEGVVMSRSLDAITEVLGGRR